MAKDNSKFVKGIEITESDVLLNKSLEITVDSGATSDTKTTLKAAQSSNVTVTLPNATDTLVGQATPDVLSNKTIDGSSLGTNTIQTTAFDVEYDNSGSTLTATNANDAVDQLDLKAEAATAGPASSTDNALVRFDGTTGKLVQNSGTTLDDSGNMIVQNDLTVLGNLQVDGATTTINTTTVDVEDANITVNKNGNQATADDVAGLTVEMTDATNVAIVYDKDVASRWKAGDVGSEAQIATVSHTQTLSNKTFSDPLKIDEQGGTPSTPASGKRLVYAKADGKMYHLGSDGIERLLSGHVSLIDISGSHDLDFNVGSVFYANLTTDATFTFSNITDGAVFYLVVAATGATRTFQFDISTYQLFLSETALSTVETNERQVFGFIRTGSIINSFYFNSVLDLEDPPSGVTYNTPTQSYQKTAYSLTVSSIGTGGPPSSYTVVSGTLPPNMSINNSTGEISGTPASGSSIGNFSFTVRASNNGGFEDIPLLINVDVPNEWPLGNDGDLTITTGNTVNLTTGVYDYENVLIESGGTLNITGHVVIGSRYNFACSGSINGSAKVSSAAAIPVTHPIDGVKNYLPGAWSTSGAGGAGGAAFGTSGRPGVSGNSSGFGSGGSGGSTATDAFMTGSMGGSGGSSGSGGSTGGISANLLLIPATLGSGGGTNNGSVNGTDGTANIINGTAGGGVGGRSGGGGGAGGIDGASGSDSVRSMGGGGGGAGGLYGNHGSKLEVYTHRSITPDGVNPLGIIDVSGGNGSSGGDGGDAHDSSYGTKSDYGYTGGGGGGGGGGSGGNGGSVELRYRVSTSINYIIMGGSGGSGGSGGLKGTKTFPLNGAEGFNGSSGAAGSSGGSGSYTTQLLS